MKKLSQILEEIALSEKDGCDTMSREAHEEKPLDEVSPPGKDYETWIKKNKARFIKQYGPEKGKQVLYARAWKMKNQYKTYDESYKSEAFSKAQIEKLKKEYETLEKIDVTSDEYKRLIAVLNNLPQPHLKSLAQANIKFVSPLARNRVKKVDERCWAGYKPTPGKKPYEKGSCMKEEDKAEKDYDGDGEVESGSQEYLGSRDKAIKSAMKNEEIYEESEHQGKKVTLNKPFRTPGGPKKFAVYVRNDKGNVVKVTFGDPNMSIKRDDPERRKSYRARHGCSDPGPKWKANYWSCKMWADTPVSKIVDSVEPKGKK